jgi:hypothetical protein
MSYRTGYYEAPPRRRVNRLLLRFTIFVWLLVFGCVGLRAFAVPAVNDLFYNRVLQAVNPDIEVPQNPREAVGTAVEQLPFNVPTLPTGTFTIPEDQATAYMSAQSDRLGVDNIQVQFVPGEMVTTVGVGPLSGTLRTEARAENGRVVLENKGLDGVIGQVISLDAIVDGLETRLNSEVSRQGRQVESIDIQQDQAVVTIR